MGTTAAPKVMSVEEFLALPDDGVERWLIRTVTVHRPRADPLALDVRGTLDGFAELPGFSCRVAELFR